MPSYPRGQGSILFVYLFIYLFCHILDSNKIYTQNSDMDETREPKEAYKAYDKDH